MTEIQDRLLLHRVANGWVVQPGATTFPSEFTHVAATPEALAEHVRSWAKATVSDQPPAPIGRGAKTE